MVQSRRALVAVIAVVLCVKLACGSALKDTTTGNDTTTPVPIAAPISTEKSVIDQLVGSLKGYRIVGITKKTCQQLGGMHIMFTCIILTPAEGWKTVRLGNALIGG
ncbi:uncharacterized protein [Argopecten irradians]|uniref:uncharacterized protein n=1 Tax=Argopecten irradians TaxID=31199 RepID=UPI00371C5242